MATLDALTGYHLVSDSIFDAGRPFTLRSQALLEDNLEILDRTHGSRTLVCGAAPQALAAADDEGGIVRAYPMLPIRPGDDVTARLAIATSSVGASTTIGLLITAGAPPQYLADVSEILTELSSARILDTVSIDDDTALAWYELSVRSEVVSDVYSLSLLAYASGGDISGVTLYSVGIWSAYGGVS